MRICFLCESEHPITRLPGEDVEEGICLKHLEEMLGNQPALDPVTERALLALSGEVWDA